MAVAGSLTYNTKLDTLGVKKGLKDVENQVSSGGTKVKNIIAALGITKLIETAIGKITNSIDGAVSRFDTMNNFEKVMSNMKISAKDSQKAIDKLSDGLQGIPTALDDGVLAVQRFTSKNEDVRKSVDIFLAVNDAILAGGASMPIQKNALEQLSQSYAKGRMDMMEWRSIQTAMPAQLKQVAQAMGLTTEELGEMLREGDKTSETMDEFIDTIIRLDKEGTNGFQSLSKQARNATGGIQTNIANMNTAIVRGIEKVIKGLNTGLKKAKLGSIGDIITKLGKTAEDVLKKVAKFMEKIPWQSIINAIKILLPIVTNLVAGFVAYHAVLKLISAISLAKKITETAIAFIQLIPSIKSAKDLMTLLNMTFKTNTIGLVVTAVGALATAFIAFSSTTSQADEDIKKINDDLKEYDETMKEVNKRKDETLSASMNEIYHYQSLYDELQNIVDENGKVKDGYEERAKLITGQLSDALGIEIDLTDGVISNYKELQKQIDILIEKKKAEAYFNAHQEEYQEAIKKETSLQKDRTKAQENYNNTRKKIEDLVDKEIEKNKDLAKYKDEIIGYYLGEIKAKDLSAQKEEIMEKMYSGTVQKLKELQADYVKYGESLESVNKKYAENEIIIKKNRDAQELLTLADQALAEGKKETADEYLNQVARVYNDTVTFNGKLEKENNDAYEKEKTNKQAYLDFLKQHQDIYSEDFIKSEEERIAKELEQLEKEKNDANEVIKKKNKETLDTTKTGLNDQLKALTDRKYEFRDAGNGNVQLYVDGVASGEPMSLKKANELTNAVITQLNNGNINAKQAGNFLTQGFASGMTSDLSSIIRAGTTLASRAIQAIRDKAQIQSPSKVTKQLGKFFDEGFEVGIKNEEKNTLKAIDSFGDDILQRMQDAVNIQTGKMSFSGISGSVSQILSSNATFEGNFNMVGKVNEDVLFEANQRVTQKKQLQTGFGG